MFIAKQLAEGTYRGSQDTASSDWVVRAWQALPPKEAGWVATAVNHALLHDSATVRAEALRALDLAPQMADPTFLLDVVTNHFDRFRGLKRAGDGPNADRGRDLVLLVAGVASGQQARAFRRRMATDPDYGPYVLATLTQQDADWTVANSPQLVNDTIDPNGARLQTILFNLRQDEKRLTQLVQTLAKSRVVTNGRLATAIQAKIRDTNLQNKLLAQLHASHH